MAAATIAMIGDHSRRSPLTRNASIAATRTAISATTGAAMAGASGEVVPMRSTTTCMTPIAISMMTTPETVGVMIRLRRCSHLASAI